jgi:hypothetical protein
MGYRLNRPAPAPNVTTNVNVRTVLNVDGKSVASIIEHYIAKGAEFITGPAVHDDHSANASPGMAN